MCECGQGEGECEGCDSYHFCIGATAAAVKVYNKRLSGLILSDVAHTPSARIWHLSSFAPSHSGSGGSTSGVVVARGEGSGAEMGEM